MGALFTPCLPPWSETHLGLLRQRFWCSSMRRDKEEMVVTCAQHKDARQAPSSLLQPLSVPHCPWSHISLHFVTGLLPSDGNTVIIMVVDQFSKSVQFIPLPKLPSTKETPDIMLNHVFPLHGLPSDIVSDRRPQFTSHIWSAFCSLLGATIRLSSGFHPQSNGQTKRKKTVHPRRLGTWNPSRPCVEQWKEHFEELLNLS